MSLLATALLYSGPNQTGASLLTGIGSGDRYGLIPNSLLSSRGLIDSIASGRLDCSAADLNLVMFHNNDYTGQFFQISLSGTQGETTFWHTGQVNSALLIASNNSGANEHRIGFVGIFRAEWDSFLDHQLQGSQVTRDVDPLLTWQMFPASDQWLSSNLTYLRIHQPLHVHMPWYWPDYQASVDYNVELYVTSDNHLRAWVADYEWWVESGAKSGQIGAKLDPQARAGMSALQTELNQKLTETDLFGAVKAVYYLPDRQLSPIGTGTFGGDTGNDITIVIQT
ncbi:MAG: hypothetical protein ABI165_07335 [Bryobacteraceae bacterium]